jgi:hypothetical protein
MDVGFDNRMTHYAPYARFCGRDYNRSRQYKATEFPQYAVFAIKNWVDIAAGEGCSSFLHAVVGTTCTRVINKIEQLRGIAAVCLGGVTFRLRHYPVDSSTF